MAAQPETTLRNGVEGKLPPKRLLHREKMNNPFSSGTADSWYSGPKADIWIEWKWVPAWPVRSTTPIVPKLRPLQAIWLNGRHAEGRRVFVVVGSPDGCIVFSTPNEWSNGVLLDDAQVLSKAEVAEWIRNSCL